MKKIRSEQSDLKLILTGLSCLFFLACGGARNSSSTGSQSTSGYALPVDMNWNQLTITDHFGPRILNGAYDFHRGLDISLDLNAEILAAKRGTVVFAGSDAENFPRAGNFVILEHELDEMTGYLHLNAIADGIEAGVVVDQGTVIGYAGDSGEDINSVHLHFNYYKNAVSGEIPSDENDTYPPLEVLPYSDTSGHVINSITVNTNIFTSVTVELSVSVPADEMDLDRVEVVITDNAGDAIYDQIVEFSSRSNCGTDEDEINSIQIVPEDFTPPQDTLDYEFRFREIDLSAYVNQTLTIEARITDISGSRKTKQGTIVLQDS